MNVLSTAEKRIHALYMYYTLCVLPEVQIHELIAKPEEKFSDESVMAGE